MFCQSPARTRPSGRDHGDARLVESDECLLQSEPYPPKSDCIGSGNTFGRKHTTGDLCHRQRLARPPENLHCGPRQLTSCKKPLCHRVAGLQKHH